MSDMTLKQVANEESELDKLSRVHEESERIGAFLDWLFDRGLVLARWHGTDLVIAEPPGYRVQALLAAYYHIDLEKLDRERTALIEEFRAQRAKEKMA